MHMMRRAGPQVVCFRSRVHPSGHAPAWVFTQHLVRPLAACMLPVMVGALVAVLQGAPALRYLTVGFPLAATAALLWTAYATLTSVAEVCVQPRAVALRTVWDCARHRPRRWEPLLELRIAAEAVQLAVPDTPYVLHQANWPAFAHLADALEYAFTHEPSDTTR